MARAMGIKGLWHVEVDAGHSPFLSRPEETIGAICAAVEGNGMGEGKASEKGQMIWEPKFQLGQPSSWVKPGVPLLLGMVIGKVVVALH